MGTRTRRVAETGNPSVGMLGFATHFASAARGSGQLTGGPAAQGKVSVNIFPSKRLKSSANVRDARDLAHATEAPVAASDTNHRLVPAMLCQPVLSQTPYKGVINLRFAAVGEPNMSPEDTLKVPSMWKVMSDGFATVGDT